MVRTLLVCVFGMAVTSVGQADDWPQWLGPQRDGVWREDGILAKFPTAGPKINWRIPMHRGYSGPAVANGRVYVMDRERAKDEKGEPLKPKDSIIQGNERVLCVDAKTGDKIWEHIYDCPYKIQYPEGPRTTPVVRDGKVYTLGAMGDLHCYDANSGKPIWQRSFPKEFNAKPPVWGFAANLLVDGERVISLVGGEGSAVVAFHKDTGKELWRGLSAEEIGYAPPMIYEAAGKRQLVIWLDLTVNALDPETGKLYWSQSHPADGKVQRPCVTIATPIKFGDFLFISEFYRGALLLKLKNDKPDAEVVWQSKMTNPAQPDFINAIMCTPYVKDGHIYGICGFGELRCLKADTGAKLWDTYATIGGKKALFANAFLTPHQDRFFFFNDQGDLIIAKLTPQGYEQIDKAHLLDTTFSTRGRDVVWCHPAYANRCMFVRNDKEMICVSLAETK